MDGRKWKADFGRRKGIEKIQNLGFSLDNVCGFVIITLV